MHFPSARFALLAVVFMAFALPSACAQKAKASRKENSAPSAAEVKFDPQRGFYERPFQLALSSKTPDALIRYTLDGSQPTAEHGTVYTKPLSIDRTTVLRTAAFKLGLAPSRTKTHTFLFPADVIRQSPDGLPPAGFPYEWGKNQVNYGMDPRIVDDRRYRDEIIPALRSLPTISLVAEIPDLFGSKRGIYSNPGEQGRDWERPASLELIHADGRKGFQIDCGIRIRGGFSRMPMNPKHAFRLFFRDQYGEGKLKYPLFGTNGVQEFDNLDLRTFQNYSWSLAGDTRAVFVRDQFHRDLQLALGQPAARGDFCHLYINGHYWGLYNTCERPEASFGAARFGGRKDDYDAIKVDSGFTTRESTYTVIPTDGNLEAWTRLYRRAAAGLTNNADYFALQGRNPDGSPNPSLENLLDVDNLIDYMLLILWGGNLDAPISAFSDNRAPNNFHALRRQKGDHGFQFFIWDAEHTLLNLTEDRTGPFRAGDKLETSNPQWLWQQCLDNAEFRLRLADHVHRHFSPGGVLHPDSLKARFATRTRQIESAVIAESARWGDVPFTVPGDIPPRPLRDGKPLTGPFTRDDDWRRSVASILDGYLPRRSGIVLGQLFAHGILPDLAPPTAVREASGDSTRTSLSTSTGSAAILYTIDGTDPRLPGGEPSPSARTYAGPFASAANGPALLARARIGSDWSALTVVP